MSLQFNHYTDSVVNDGKLTIQKNGTNVAEFTANQSANTTANITVPTALTDFSVTATAAELNTLDGITATTTELNYVDGVTSNVQTQLNNKVNLAGDTMTGHLKIDGSASAGHGNLYLKTDGGAYVYITGDEDGTASNVGISTQKLQYIKNLTSDVQTQLNNKQATITGAATTIASSDLTASKALISNTSGKVAVSAVTSTELGYLDGVTSNVQTQLDKKLEVYEVTIDKDTTVSYTLPTSYRGFFVTNMAVSATGMSMHIISTSSTATATPTKATVLAGSSVTVTVAASRVLTIKNDTNNTMRVTFIGDNSNSITKS